MTTLPTPAMPVLHPLRPASRPSSAPRWLAAGLWLLAGLSASYWGLRGWGDSALAPVPQLVPERAGADIEALARALGAAASAPAPGPEAPAPSRHVLLGVVRDAQGRGIALIASDGRPARPYRIGAALPDGLVLRELTPREALLGPVEGGTPQRLSLPTRP